QPLSIAVTLCAPKLTDHPVRSGAIDDSPQHAVVAQDSNLLVGVATRGCVARKRNQSSSGQLSNENGAILHSDRSRPGTICQGPLISKKGLRAAHPLEAPREPAHQINQVNSNVPHRAKTPCFFLIAPPNRQIGISPSFAEPPRLHVQDTTSDVSFLHEL